jgi:hypothetical protein
MPLALAAALLVPASGARAGDDVPLTGTWSIESWTKKDGANESWLSLRWSRGGDHWSGRSIKLARVPELTPDRIEAAPSTVHFEINAMPGRSCATAGSGTATARGSTT